MGRHSIAGDDAHTFIYSFTSRGNLESPIYLPACFWKVERPMKSENPKKARMDIEHEKLQIVVILRAEMSI